jgi:DNA polymerase-3 subunit delta'
VARLARSVAAGRPGHAYLFIGPPQVGKRTLALAFAQALNCLADRRPCGQCRACLNIARGSHPDVRLVTGDEGTIKIDHVRALQRELALSPYEGRWRVAILPGMERATVEAGNCLLKTLEEPPAQVVLVLTATDVDLLLPTIVSRCQQVNLHPLPVSEVEVALRQRWGIDQDRARLLARLSGGRIGWAVEAAQDPSALTRRDQRLDRLVALSGASRVDRLGFAEQVARRAEDLPDLLEEWLGWWRDLLLTRGGCPDAVTNVDRREQLDQQAWRYSPAQIVAVIRELQATLIRLEQNVNPRLAMEVLVLHLPVGN